MIDAPPRGSTWKIVKGRRRTGRHARFD